MQPNIKQYRFYHLLVSFHDSPPLSLTTLIKLHKTDILFTITTFNSNLSQCHITMYLICRFFFNYNQNNV